MRVTTWTEYSLIISIHLARRSRTGSGPLAARELADAERLPADYVEQILLRLRRAGLVESVRGARGGYLLAKEPTTIFGPRRDDRVGASDVRGQLRAHPVDAGDVARLHLQHPARLDAFQQRVDELLASISLADLMKQEPDVVELVGISSSS